MEGGGLGGWEGGFGWVMRQDVREANNPISQEIKKVRFIRGCLARGAALLKRKKKTSKRKEMYVVRWKEHLKTG
jgi:hypothetical protein